MVERARVRRHFRLAPLGAFLVWNIHPSSRKMSCETSRSCNNSYKSDSTYYSFRVQERFLHLWVPWGTASNCAAMALTHHFVVHPLPLWERIAVRASRSRP